MRNESNYGELATFTPPGKQSIFPRRGDVMLKSPFPLDHGLASKAMSLTPDRSQLGSRIHSEIQHCRDHNCHGTVICIGIDRFDRLRRVYGLFVTDALVRELSLRIQHILAADDTVIYLGGDEFLVLPADKAADRTHMEGFAKGLSLRLAALTDEPFDCDGTSVSPSLTIGTVCYPEGTESVESLIQKAVNTLGQAKFFPAGIESVTQEKIDFLNHCYEVEKALYSSLTNNELSVQYQPIVDISSGEVIGAEVLLRWLHPKFGYIAPDLFISVAEETGQILAIGDWVFQQVAQQFSHWVILGLDLNQFFFAVNISPRQFMEPDFVGKITHFLDTSQLTASNLHLEITENVAMSDFDATAERVMQLNRLGIRCAIDDFGTGYSSLTYLRQLPCGTLKLDKSFINDFLTNIYSRAIVESTINLAKVLGLEVIAEGVEHGDQYIELKNLGCNAYQGYFFSPAIPADELFLLLV
jgi:diguanylate cyclase (GGDEF)-like protein